MGDDGLYSAAGGMLLQIKRQEAIAQNLAASSIPGYKREFIVSNSFKSTLNSELGSGMAGSLSGTDAGKPRYDFTLGTRKKTERRLDFAFDSYTRESESQAVKGSQLFFQVKSADGQTLLTRNGCFVLSNDRSLSTAEGHVVMNENGGPITLGDDDIVANLTVSSDGQVKVEDRSTSPSTIKNLGFIQLARAENPQALIRYTANYFADPDGVASVKPADPADFNMMNGYYEDSNSSPIHEMNAMIQSVREYEFQARAIRSVHDIYRQERTKLS